MRVTFDEGFTGSTSGEREMLPDGVHNVTIRTVTERDDKTTIVLAPNGPYRLVYVDLKNDAKGQAKASALAAALGMSARDWAGSEPGDLVGRELRLETHQWVSDRDGKTRVSVDKFLAPEVVVGTRPGGPKPRTQAAKVAAARGDEAGGEDDVPF